MNTLNRKSWILAKKLIIAATTLGVHWAAHAVTWPATPAGSTISAIPMTMLVASKDHKMFYEAYNDASDVDGDGTLDTRFKPGITYYGLFESTYCYGYLADYSLFYPAGTAGTAGVCSSAGAQWSGNWLNYMTTARIDALRKVLYGGHREIDTTAYTVLRRAYIPQDAHSWGKEYTSETVDGYKISDYTPFSQPDTGTRHFFGNLTANLDTNCSTLNSCSDLNPLLRIRRNVGSGKRVWEWASKERPVLHDSLSSGGFPAGTAAEENYAVRVWVCREGYRSGCKAYPNSGDTAIYKPVGLLHEYGESDAMYFGLLTGSYDDNMAGGRLRKLMGSFANEVDAQTGQFKAYKSGGSATDSRIVTTFDRLRIRDYNNARTDRAYRGGWVTNRAMNAGEFVDWGNPVGEMIYEATRYLGGKGSHTGAFNSATTKDTEVGLPTVASSAWDNPYDSTSAPGAAQCSRASFLTISDVNPSFDSDQLPGSYFNAFSGDLTGLNVETLGNTITGVESNITGQRFIGQSGTSADSAPSPKAVTSLGNIRGLAPEEPTKQGSYYSASVAFYAKTNDINTAVDGKQTIDSYVVAMSSPLPKIIVSAGSGTVTLVPFAKSVGGSGISSAKTSYQPTNQIVDFYVQTIANSGAGDADEDINGGRYYAEFLINFEDVEQGADHDMDVVAKYIIKKEADGRVSVQVQPTYQAGGIIQHMGYVISGTTADGVYLVAADETGGGSYYLNVPAGRTPGYCDTATPAAACSSLPVVGGSVTFTYTAGTSGGATLLKDPLWYAAKYGGFTDRNNSNTPDLDLEWDVDGDSVPDTYFLVQNPLKLRDSLKKAFDTIVERNSSAGNVIANSTTTSTEALVYRGTFSSSRWSGDLTAYAVTDAGLSSVAAWRASENVPAASSRKIFYKADTGSGKSFEWSQLSTAEQGLISSTFVLNYIRGDRSKEILSGGTFRDRQAGNVLGDIAHSSPAYVKDTNTVYVGGNDGMLHAFNAETGAEQFAFIPSSSLSRLRSLTSVVYNENHKYFVDGDIAVSSRAQTTSENYLVGTLGRGGKGLFGLRVTNPSSFATSDVKWEYMSATDADLGYMLGRPVIAKMKNGEWAVIVGNGYNSTDGKSVLYIFNLTTGALMRKIDTGVGGDNGLSTPGVRLDASGVARSVYAGDLKGNLWEFDVSGTTTATWVVSNSGSPFYIARDSAGNAQPITAPVTMAVNDVSSDVNYGKLFVYVGTGSNFQVADSTSTTTQTLYGLIDDDTAITGRTDLRQREFTDSGTISGTSVRVLSSSTVGDMTGLKGFYLDWSESGERVVTAANYYKLLEPVLFVSSVIPVTDVCVPGGRGYLNAVNAFTGARLTKPLFDVDGDGGFTDDTLGSAYVSSLDPGVGAPGEMVLVGKFAIVGGTDAIADPGINLSVPIKGRVSWREIVSD